MLKAPMSMVGGLETQFWPGDLLNLSENLQTIASDTAYTYSGKEIASGDIFHTLISANRIMTLPGSDDIIAALMGNLNAVSPPNNELYGLQPNRSVTLAWPANASPIQPGSTFRRLIVSTTAFSITMAVPASKGISLGAAPYDQTVIAASTWREYLFKILNSSPTVIIPVDQTTGTKPLTVPASNLEAIRNITPGMSAYGTNIAASTKVAAVNQDTGVITLDTNVTATIANNPVTFTPTIVMYGLRSGTL
jgi:hypothetical protein